MKSLQRCDIFLPELNCIVEIDESQHFTAARAISLSSYPKSLVLGYDKKQWLQYCGSYNRKDPNPPYRDEQRAWYDTLRDFLPLLKDLNPTIRIHIGDIPWCSLNPKSKRDRVKFRELVFVNEQLKKGRTNG